jgi:hypothetical protein
MGQNFDAHAHDPDRNAPTQGSCNASHRRAREIGRGNQQPRVNAAGANQNEAQCGHANNARNTA